MIVFSEIPINSLSWLFGAIACLALGIKSWLVYRQSFNQLTKYIAWFGIMMGIALTCFAIPPLFTTDPESLRPAWVIGEFIVYASLIPQAAILWSLVLRSHMPVYAVTIPTGLAGFAAWLYAAPHLTLSVSDNFISYSEPGASSFTMAVLLVCLFVPVGFHFLRATLRQTQFKAKLTTFVLGMVYIGIGVSTGGHLLLIGQVASPMSSFGNIAFFIVLIGAVAWPRRAQANSPTSVSRIINSA